MSANKYGYEMAPLPCVIRVGDEGRVLGVRLLTLDGLGSEFLPYQGQRYLGGLWSSKYQALEALKNSLKS